MLRGGVSMDQVLAAHLGDQTAQPSLVLGCEQPITGYHETNFSMAYSSHISWQDANSPVPMEVYPSLAFDSLFDNHGSRRTLSILDRVKDQAAALKGQVSLSDRAKLDEYLTSVREVEKRVERTRTAKGQADERRRDRGRPAFTMRRPDNGLPEDIREHMRLMCDIIALAFQTDKTRVATLLLCRDLSGLFYPFLGVRTAHHPTSHEDHSDAYERVTRYYVGQLEYLAGRLARCRKAIRPFWTTRACCSSPICGRGVATTRARFPCCWSGAWEENSPPAASSITASAATTTANSAACTWRCWSVWG